MQLLSKPQGQFKECMHAFIHSRLTNIVFMDKCENFQSYQVGLFAVSEFAVQVSLTAMR